MKPSIEGTADGLDECDRNEYRSIIEPLATHFGKLIEEILGPIQHIPRHPLLIATFGAMALSSAAAFVRSHFKGTRARALFAGVSTHSILPLESTASAAVGLLLLAAGHSGGWPILQGGAQSLTNLLVRHLEELGGTVVTGHEVTRIPDTDLVLADVTPRQLYEWKVWTFPITILRDLGAFATAQARSRSTMRLAARFPGLPKNVSALVQYISAALSKKLWKQSVHLRRNGRSSS